MFTRGQGNLPFVSRRVGQLVVRMITNHERHRFKRQVGDLSLDLEIAVLEPIGDVDRVREGPLCHVGGNTEKLQSKCVPRLVGPIVDPDHLPLRGVVQQPVDRLFAPIKTVVAHRRIQCIVLAIGIEAFVVQSVGPRGQEWRPQQCRLSFQLAQLLVRRKQDLLPFYLHAVSVGAQAGSNADNDVGRRVAQGVNANAVIDGGLGFIAGGREF